MLSFKSISDLSKLPTNDPAYPIIEDLAHKLLTTESKVRSYDHEAYGWIVLLNDEQDTDRPLKEIWGENAYSLTEIPWEGISRHQDDSRQDCFYIGIFLANNDFGLVFVIPDVPWLPDDLVKVLEENLIPTPENSIT